MSQYLVSARKYRPTQFIDVVGQQHITTTLKNAIKSAQVAQSFLFCGPRGVGKTTCARILAKVLNCENKTSDFEPCNTCSSCSAFNQNASFNIFELDAASNNSVEDIRQLIEQVRFAPQTGQYKIYIIDEVHMLSTGAFNAFLKTLEEPPSYAIFILATTEKHKLLPTIVSRCQVFDFHRITNQAIVEHLAYIAKAENTEAESEALHIIAQKADGGLRDALSIYDRMSSFSGGIISYQAVLENLNILDYDYFFKITDSLQIQDRAALMLILDEILRNGFDGGEFIGGLAAHLRNLMMAQADNTVKILEVSDNWRMRYQQQAQGLPTGFILSCLNIANNCALNYRDAKNKRLQIELALLKMCYIQQAVDLSKQAHVLPPQVINTNTNNSNTPQATNTSPIEPQNTSLAQAAAPQAKAIAVPNPTVDKVEEKTPPILTPSANEDKKTAFKTKTNTPTNNLKLGGSLESVSDALLNEQNNNKKPILDINNIPQLWENYIQSNQSPRVQELLKEHRLTVENQTLSATTYSTFNQVEYKNELKIFIENLKMQFEGVELKCQVFYEEKETTHLPQKAYTLEDKYQAMLAKNPALELLKNGLNLELEY